MSDSSEATRRVISWRWKVLVEWFVCSWRGHDWQRYEAFHALDANGWSCRRCLADKPGGRMRIMRDGCAYWDVLDIDGNVVSSHWRYGKAAHAPKPDPIPEGVLDSLRGLS